MTADAVLVLRAIFSLIWRLFTSWYIPGTHTTPAAFAIFLLVSGLVLRSTKFLLGAAGNMMGKDTDRE